MRQSITLLSLLLLTHLAPARAWRDFNPDIARISAAGGGTVVVPAGEWETGPIHLKSNIELHFEDGADVLFTDDLEKYLPPVEISWEGVECLNWSPLVYANGATNVAGDGVGASRRLRPVLGGRQGEVRPRGAGRCEAGEGRVAFRCRGRRLQGHGDLAAWLER